MHKKISRFVWLIPLFILLAACVPQQQVPENSLIGATAPEFTLEDTLGGQTSLSDYQGTPVLLFFHMAVG